MDNDEKRNLYLVQFVWTGPGVRKVSSKHFATGSSEEAAVKKVRVRLEKWLRGLIEKEYRVELQDPREYPPGFLDSVGGAASYEWTREQLEVLGKSDDLPETTDGNDMSGVLRVPNCAHDGLLREIEHALNASRAEPDKLCATIRIANGRIRAVEFLE